MVPLPGRGARGVEVRLTVEIVGVVPIDGNSYIDAPNPNSFNDPPNVFTNPPQPQSESYSCELCENGAHYGYDCPPRASLVYEHEPGYDNYDPQNSPSFPQQYLCIENCRGPHESFQCQPLNQNYFEPNSTIPDLTDPRNYHNERIDIRYRRECEIKTDELKGKFNGMGNEINKKKKLRQLEHAANLSTYNTKPS
ncbi:hypothetical protein Tco_1046448 [Tanacetum coccineum]